MDFLNNKSERIDSLEVAISGDQSITINRLGDGPPSLA